MMGDPRFVREHADALNPRPGCDCIGCKMAEAEHESGNRQAEAVAWTILAALAFVCMVLAIALVPGAA